MSRIARAKFQVGEEMYFIEIELGFFKIKNLYIGKASSTEYRFLSGNLYSEIAVEWENLSILEGFKMWLIELKRNSVKKR